MAIIQLANKSKLWPFQAPHNSSHKLINLSFNFKKFSYRPNYPVELLIQTLAFDTKEKCEEWMTPFCLTFADSKRTIIDCKNSATSSLPLMVWVASSSWMHSEKQTNKERWTAGYEHFRNEVKKRRHLYACGLCITAISVRWMRNQCYSWVPTVWKDIQLVYFCFETTTKKKQ